MKQAIWKNTIPYFYVRAKKAAGFRGLVGSLGVERHPQRHRKKY